MVEHCFWEAGAVGSNPIIPIHNHFMKMQELEDLESFTVEEFQSDFDNLMQRVENGETIGVENIITGERAVIIPADDELIRIYTEHNEAS